MKYLFILLAIIAVAYGAPFRHQYRDFVLEDFVFVLEGQSNNINNGNRTKFWYQMELKESEFINQENQ